MCFSMSCSSRFYPPAATDSFGEAAAKTMVDGGDGRGHFRLQLFTTTVPDIVRNFNRTSRTKCVRLLQSGGRQTRLHCNLAYSALACFKMGMSGSASFQRVRKSLYAASARTRAASASAACEVFACKAFARATPRCANAPVQQFQTMPLWSMIFWNSAAAAPPCPAAR